MTGQQEHPGTGRTLNHDQTGRIRFEDLARAMGVQNVHVVSFQSEDGTLARLLTDLLARPETSLVVTRQPCVLAAPKIRFYEKAAADRLQTCPSQLADD
jgi:indolepyruvate ferredoxin oxidoreductase alpha subunit